MVLDLAIRKQMQICQKRTVTDSKYLPCYAKESARL